MLLELKRIHVPPGQRVILENVTWKELETIIAELGEHRAARIAYDRGILEIISPLAEHQFDKEIISDLVKALLEELNIEFRCLGSTTFKNQFMAQGIEPDQCFYIQNEAVIRGKKRLDLTIDPPPDLALEIDITSRTHLNIYQGLQVPEVWRFENGILQINLLQNGVYVESKSSLNFPNLPLIEVIPESLQKSRTIGRNATLKAFKNWVNSL
ncbi:Uma2 family endonuclease [Dolichospermum sp. FACHB-1091]|uniref:Uma2 family endonuclease n=1 Tax=Dolichospermum sp. FACHB-1091 TaxID=2692798 RepID=UPI001680AFCC|nr:Uma2 family endonuclease [Dolichospermum sp. FACHB-1091]MBD2445470.1 Uma2 family endonuclease [Dolichospermum sp. FACHB-1091]